MVETDKENTAAEETDCEVNVYKGSWATCDMNPEDEDKES